MHAVNTNADILWRVWVLPGEGVWTLASGLAMKDNRQARKVTLSGERYARLIDGTLGVDEPLDHMESATLERAA